MDGWPCWAISNHDVVRAVTRWGGGTSGTAFAVQMVALVCALRGSVCLYQGEELGLPEADVPYEALRDPYGITFWPNFKGRDSCRTPMPWTGDADAGFSTGTPWLPIPDAHRALSIDAQRADADSVLSHTRRFLQWRRTQPALRTGDIAFLDTPEPVLAFVRTAGDARVLVVFNLSPSPVTWTLPPGMTPTALDAHGVPMGMIDGTLLRLPAHGLYFGALTDAD